MINTTLAKPSLTIASTLPENENLINKRYNNILEALVPHIEMVQNQFKAENWTFTDLKQNCSFLEKSCRSVKRAFQSAGFKIFHRDSYSQVKKQGHALRREIKEIISGSGKASTFLEAVKQLRALRDNLSIFTEQSDAFTRFLDKKELNLLKHDFLVAFTYVSEKTLSNFESDCKLGEDIIQTLLVDAGELRNSMENLLVDQFFTKEKYADFLHQDGEMEAILKRVEDVNATQGFLDEKVYQQFVARLIHLQQETKNDFFEIALKADIQKAIDNKLLSKKTKKLFQDPTVRKKFKKVHKLRLEKLQQEHRIGNEDHLLLRKIAKAQFAASLGVKSDLSPKGVNGAQFIKGVTFNGKTRKGVIREYLGVFKKPSVETYFDKFKHLIGINQHSLLHSGEFADMAAEKAAYMIAKKMNAPQLTLAPAEIISYKDFKGAFLLWQSNCKLAGRDETGKLNGKEEFTENELNLFQIFIAFDFLLGNLDRHGDNWMFKESADGEINKIIPIDNANILPQKEKNYLNWKTLGWHISEWNELNIAQKPFTEETIRLIAALGDNFVNEICEEIRQDPKISTMMEEDPKNQGTYPSIESEGFMQHRFDLLKKAVSGELKTPYELSKA